MAINLNSVYAFQTDRNRKTYVEATNRLVSFLDEVTNALQSASPIHRKLIESTKAEVSRVAKRAAGKRLSLDPAALRLSKAESMPGKLDYLGGSCNHDYIVLRILIILVFATFSFLSS